MGVPLFAIGDDAASGGPPLIGLYKITHSRGAPLRVVSLRLQMQTCQNKSTTHRGEPMQQ